MFYKTRYLKQKTLTLLIILFVFLCVSTAYAINTISEGYRVDLSESKQVNSPSICRNISNTTGNAYFIPTRADAEFSSFLTYLPSGVTAESCCVWNVGNACNSVANSCGVTDSGIVNCDGSCSASKPITYQLSSATYSTSCEISGWNYGGTSCTKDDDVGAWSYAGTFSACSNGGFPGNNYDYRICERCN
jgi:hypothetical protein